MRTKFTLVAVLLTSVLVAAGCGGDSSPDTQEDEAAITALIKEVNRVSEEQDAQGFCALMQPSGVKATFSTQQRCVEQTGAILKQSGANQPKLEIEDISIDGDQATVDLKSGAGGAPVELVKEGGKWYVPFASQAPDTSTGASGSSDSTEVTGATGATGE